MLFSSVFCLVKTSLHLDADINPTFCLYHSLHFHCSVVFLSTSSISLSVKTSVSLKFSGGVSLKFSGVLSLSPLCIHQLFLALFLDACLISHLFLSCELRGSKSIF